MKKKKSVKATKPVNRATEKRKAQESKTKKTEYKSSSDLFSSTF